LATAASTRAFPCFSSVTTEAPEPSDAKHTPYRAGFFENGITVVEIAFHNGDIWFGGESLGFSRVGTAGEGQDFEWRVWLRGEELLDERSTLFACGAGDKDALR